MTRTSHPKIDHYGVLGVHADATLEEIRAAYLAKVRLSHPDIAPGETEEGRRAATEATALLNEAYECLSDPDRRHAYDSGHRAHRDPGRHTPGTLLVSPANPRCDVAPGDVVRLRLDVWASDRADGGSLRIRGPKSLSSPRVTADVSGDRARLDLRLDTSSLAVGRVYHVPIQVMWGELTSTITLAVHTTGRGAADSRRRPPGRHDPFRQRRRSSRTTRSGAVGGRLMRWSLWALICAGVVFLGIPAALVVASVLFAAPFLGLVFVAIFFGRDDNRTR